MHAQIDPDEEDSEIADVSVNRQFWTDFNMKHAFNENQSLSGFIGYRTITPHIFNKLVIVPTYNFRHVKTPKWIKREKPIINSFHLGGGLFYTNNTDELDSFELRLMQGMQIFTPEVLGIYFKNYFRLEERFQKTYDESWSLGLRLRYKISTVFEWKKRGTQFNKGLYVPVSIEFFFNFNPANRDNDQIRISPGIGYKFNEDWRCEFSVAYHNSTNVSADDQTTNDFVFRLRIFKSNVKKGLFIRDKEDQLKELMEE